MRLVIYLILAFILIFGAQSIYYRSQTGSALASALARVPQSPDKGFDAIKPVFDYGETITFGAAPAARVTFFNAVRDRAVDLLRPDSRLDAAGVRLLDECLHVLGTAMRERHAPVEKHLEAVLTAARDASPELMRTLDLATWDAYIAVLVRADGQLWVPAAFQDEMRRMIQSARQIDRESFAHREARDLALDALREGGVVIGFTVQISENSPPLGALARPLTPAQLLQSDAAYGRGQEALKVYAQRHPSHTFPADLALLRAKLAFNVASIRLSHLLTEGDRLLAQSSSYLVHLFVGPAVGTPPTPSEMAGSLINSIGEDLGTVIRVAEPLSEASAPGSTLLKAAAYGAALRWADAVRLPVPAPSAPSRYSALCGEAVLLPGGTEAVGVIEGAGGLAVMLK